MCVSLDPLIHFISLQQHTENRCSHKSKQVVYRLSMIDATTLIDRDIADQVKVAGNPWPNRWGKREATSKKAYEQFRHGGSQVL